VLIVDVVTRLVIALICGVIATMATREKKTVAMLWIRGGVVLIGLGALTDAIVSIATGSTPPFVVSMAEALLWSLLSTVGVGSFLRNRRRPTLAERLTTTFAALSSSFGVATAELDQVLDRLTG